MPNYTYARSQGRNRFGRRRYGKYVTKNYLRAVVGPIEQKFTDYTQTALAILNQQNVNSILPLNAGISQGTGQSNRIGNQVQNRSVHIRFDLSRVTVDSFVRVILFWWLDGSLTTNTPTLAQILESPANYQSPLNKEYGKSFWVKFDRTYTLAAGQTQLQTEEIYRKLKCVTEWNDTAGPQTGISHNSLHILFISSQSLTNAPTLNLYSRVNFTDL